MDSRTTKGLDPSLVWSEILGTICGSEQAIASPAGYLQRDEYIGLSERAHAPVP